MKSAERNDEHRSLRVPEHAADRSCEDAGGTRKAAVGPRPSQPFPKTGRLHDTLNLPWSDLRSLTRGYELADVYCYVVASIKRREDGFVQLGNSPNWQGGTLTLCACKHYMRTFLDDTRKWKGKWIAGLTSKNLTPEGRNALVYLMKVGESLENYAELWQSRKLSRAALEAKAADKQPCGDLYRPNQQAHRNPFDHLMYERPRSDHVHAEGNKWYNDVHYCKGIAGRSPALLIGDEALSFLWSKPVILLAAPRIPRSQKKMSIGKLLGRLEPK